MYYSELINTELVSIKNKIDNVLKTNISLDTAFEYLILQLFCYKTTDIVLNLYDMTSAITNGPNDGGIDFVYFDDEEMKVILGQCKYTSSMKLNDVISELNKMSSTVENFKNGSTGAYNDKIKLQLQNALDQLTEENIGNVEYWIFTTTEFNESSLINKIEKEHNNYSKDMVNIYDLDDVGSKIKESIEKSNTVSHFKANIDKANNALHYETDKVSGVMVNISSSSIIKMFNKYKDEGLLDLNIRKYVRNKSVDDGIKKTLDKDRDNFWFYNNGLTIACSEFSLDGNTVNLYDFSIINGGQTTNRIGNYKGNNSQEFFIPCKIISIKKEYRDLYSKIAEATNSQKPIFARDLKSNSPEMKMLKKWLGNEGICLEIKRGEKIKNTSNIKIKNDELGQLILSFVYQQPGTARSGKKTIFENNAYYNKIFKVNYEKESGKKNFIIDLIKLSRDYDSISIDLKNGNDYNDQEKAVLSNAKYVIIALIGLTYLIVNGDYSKSDLISDLSILKDPNFTYNKFISNYKDDDYYELLESLIKIILESLCESYETGIINGSLTSISNLFKTDKKYRETIVKDYLTTINKRTYKKEFDYSSVILKRK